MTGRLAPLVWNVRAVFQDFVLNVVISSYLIPKPLRWRLLRKTGLRIENCAIAPKVFVGGRNLEIGSRTFVNNGVFFDCSAMISIGQNCDIGPHVTFITGSHEIGSQERRAGAKFSMPIDIGDGVWIGAGATILPGVSIGSGAVIAAGSIVNRDCHSNRVYAGVPARELRDLEAETAE